MARIARFVAEGFPHHITQRGNARKIVFEDTDDRRVYLNLLRAYSEEHRLGIWAWCLMTNHVHLLAVPRAATAMARALGRTHSDYARYRNAKSGNCGHLWQARYYSCPVDASGVWAVMAYIERNPVRAGLAESAEGYPWSSARAHAANLDETGFLEMAHWRANYSAARWRETLRDGVEEEALQERLRSATLTGRPFGSTEFAAGLEVAAQRKLLPGRAGRPKRLGPVEATQEPMQLREIGE
jgi:putative transposase